MIACLPYGQYGIASATSVAMQLKSSFSHIRFGLMVGIGGGIPNEEADIRLGDVVVSKPTHTHGGVVQFDYGKALNGGEFQRTGMLSQPPQILLTALSKLQANHITGRSRFLDFLAEIERKIPQKSSPLARPTKDDCLYRADHIHVDVSSKTCCACDETKTVSRPSRDSNQPMIHYGLIASSNQLVRDSQLRDELGRELDAYCVEMEAAGLMNNYPCLVIRGICDYADSHKNKEWQGYAATVAAAYAKELLSVISVLRIDQTRTVEDTLLNPGMYIKFTKFIVSKYNNHIQVLPLHHIRKTCRDRSLRLLSNRLLSNPVHPWCSIRVSWMEFMWAPSGVER